MTEQPTLSLSGLRVCVCVCVRVCRYVCVYIDVYVCARVCISMSRFELFTY